MNITQKVVRRARSRYGVEILWHRAWGSKARGTYAARRRYKRVRVAKADTVAQHITVTRPSGDFAADVRVVERIGQDRFGSGVSYNFVVNMADGRIAVGQPLDAKGTHTLNNKGVKGYSFDQNHAARAIAVLGMPGTPLSGAARESIAGLLAAMMDEGAITERFDYRPHSFFAWKDCPCDATRDAMPGIYRRAQELRRSKPEAEKPKPKPEPKKPRGKRTRGGNVDKALWAIGRALKHTANREKREARLKAARRALRSLPSRAKK